MTSYATEYNVTKDGVNIGVKYIYTYTHADIAKLNSMGFNICRVIVADVEDKETGEKWVYYYHGKTCNVRLSNAH